MKYVLEESLLCWGPMSKNIVDTLITFSNDYKLNITLIPSRRQIEYNGGYVNNWTTKDFVKYVKSRSKYVAIQRDHGGPGQGLNDDDGFESLKHDCQYCDSIHIDPWLKYQNFEDGLGWTLEMIQYCYKLNNKLYFEVGTEEAIRPFDIDEIEKMLIFLKTNLSPEIFERILFCVIQSGTALKDGENIGNYNNDKLQRMIELVNKFGIKTKEHNGDFMDNKIMQDRFSNNLSSINIAPELGMLETKFFMKNIEENSENFNKIYDICFQSNKWKKWVSDSFDPASNKRKLIEICGHYIFSNEVFKNIKYSIDSNIDDAIQKNLYDYLLTKYDSANIFYKKQHLKDVIRIHPPKEEQKVDGRIRMHRAERLEPYPQKFFNNFLDTISQEDFRYYPDVHGFKKKISEFHNISEKNLMLNNGSSEIIRNFYEAFAVENKNILITNPCYPLHEVYAKMNNSNIVKIDYNKNTWDINNMIDKINEETCCICFANPNSPFGDIKSIEEIKLILNKASKFKIPTLIDEAYIEYSDNKSCISLLDEYENLLISRTFSKGLGVAGLRCGYIVGNFYTMQIIQKFVPSYEITSIMCKFGSYLLENYNIVDEYIKKIKEEKEKIKVLCRDVGIPVVLNHINTIHLKPNNLNDVINYLKENNVLHRTRKIPIDSDNWLPLVLFPDLCNSEMFKNIIEIHKK